MTLALIIGILLGMGSIMFSRLLKGLDERTFYALILSAIGALYVGFSWTDISSLIINIIQCFFFGALAYFGIKKSVYFLATGFILHGIFDIAYSFFPGSRLIPPHYDLFCISVDWIIGFYLFLIKYKQIKLIAKTLHIIPRAYQLNDHKWNLLLEVQERSRNIYLKTEGKRFTENYGEQTNILSKLRKAY